MGRRDRVTCTLFLTQARPAAYLSPSTSRPHFLRFCIDTRKVFGYPISMPNDHVITIRLPKALYALLPKNYSALIRRLLREYFDSAC